MDTPTKTAPITMIQTHPEPLTRQELLPLLLATIAMGFPLARILVPSFVKPGLLTPLFLLVLWFVWRLTQPRRFVQSPLAIPLLLNVVVLILSTLFSAVPGETVLPLLFHWGAAMGIMLFLTIDMLAHGWRPHIITHAVLIVISIALIYAAGVMLWWWVSWLQVWQPGEVLFPVSFRRFIIKTQPNQAAMIINSGLPLVIIALWQARNRWYRLLWATWIGFAIIILFTTSSRGGWIATMTLSGTILLPLLWHLFRQRRWKSIGRTLAMTGGYATLFVLLFLANYRSVHQLHAGRVHFTAAPDPSSAVDLGVAVQGLSHSSGRDTFWRIAMELFQKHPLFGVGPYGYSIEYYKLLPDIGYLPPHAHSIYFAFLSETGIAGTVALAILIIAIVWVWWRGWRKHPPLSDRWLLMLGTAATGAGLAAHGLVDVPTRQVGGTVVYVVAAGLALAGCWQLVGKDKDMGEHSSPSRRFSMPHPVHTILVVAAILTWGVALAVFVLKPTDTTAEEASTQHLQVLQQTAAQAVMIGEYAQATEQYATAPARIALEHMRKADLVRATLARQQAVVLAWQAIRNPAHPHDLTLLKTALEAQQALAAQPTNADDPVSRFNQAALLVAMGQQTAPLSVLHTLVPTATSHSAAYVFLAQQYEQQADVTQARAMWEATLQSDPMLAHSAVCQQSAICPTVPLPHPLSSKQAALATAWQIYQQPTPDDEAPYALWELGYTWSSVEIWAICALTAEQVGNTHMYERCLFASRDQATMEDHKPTRQLAIVELRKALAAQDSATIRQLVQQWIYAPTLSEWVPQITYPMLTTEDRLLAETAWEAVQITGDTPLIAQCRTYRAFVVGAFTVSGETINVTPLPSP